MKLLMSAKKYLFKYIFKNYKKKKWRFACLKISSRAVCCCTGSRFLASVSPLERKPNDHWIA